MKERIIDYLPVSSFDKYIFHQGNHHNSYNFLGAHLIEYKGFKGVNFTLWSPNAKQVNLVGDFNDWIGIDYPMKKVSDSGMWNIFISDLTEEQLYKYEIHTVDGERILKADPYAYYSEVRPNTASRIFSLDKYEWNDGEWMEEKKKNLYTKNQLIYMNYIWGHGKGKKMATSTIIEKLQMRLLNMLLKWDIPI